MNWREKRDREFAAWLTQGEIDYICRPRFEMFGAQVAIAALLKALTSAYPNTPLTTWEFVDL